MPRREREEYAAPTFPPSWERAVDAIRDKSYRGQGKRIRLEYMKIKCSVAVEVVLDGAGLGDQHASLLAFAVGLGASPLRRASIAYNHISDVGAVSIAEALKTNEGLLALHLGYNRIGNRGACAVLDAIPKQGQLVTLSLSGTSVGNPTARRVSKTVVKKRCGTCTLDTLRTRPSTRTPLLLLPKGVNCVSWI